MELERPRPSTSSGYKQSPSDTTKHESRMYSIVYDESDDSTSLDLLDELEDGTDQNLHYLPSDNETIQTEHDSSNVEKYQQLKKL